MKLSDNLARKICWHSNNKLLLLRSFFSSKQNLLAKYFFHNELSQRCMHLCFIGLHCKKRWSIFPSPAGISLTTLSLAGINLIYPDQGEFGKWYPGWGRENGKPFFTVYVLLWCEAVVHGLQVQQGGGCGLPGPGDQPQPASHSRQVSRLSFCRIWMCSDPFSSVTSRQGVTKRWCLSWVTNTALVYEPKCGGRGLGCGISANEYSCTQEPK